MIIKTTPGPWVIEYEFNVKNLKGRGVASCGGYSSNVDSEKIRFENIANARLIAAAPDLLCAAKLAVQFVENGVEYGYIKMPNVKVDTALDTLPKLKAAIAKAEGKEGA